MKQSVLVLMISIAVATALAYSSYAVTFDWAIVGNPGNAGDTEVRFDGTTGWGAVDYVYRISKHEVTNAQYVDFLNAVDPNGQNSLGLYNPMMSTSDFYGGIQHDDTNTKGSKYSPRPNRENKPVTFVSFIDAMRFANWLHNGQGAGSTELGAYTIGPDSYGVSETRSSSARYFIPSEDEWYKAAYHKNDGVTGNYWDYPTGTDEEPYSDDPNDLDTPDNTNVANFYKDDGIDNGYNNGPAVGEQISWPPQYRLTDVGAYSSSQSSYGTFDQAGNVSEWNERVVNDEHLGPVRSVLGGIGWREGNNIQASSSGAASAYWDFVHIGFRVAGAVPETSTNLLGAIAIALLSPRRCRARELSPQTSFGDNPQPTNHPRPWPNAKLDRVLQDSRFPARCQGSFRGQGRRAK